MFLQDVPRGWAGETGVVALDGTKVAAAAALAANRSYAMIEEEVSRMLKETKRVDAEEDLLFGPEGRGDELPQELGRRGERLSRLGEAKARLDEEATRAVQPVRPPWSIAPSSETLSPTIMMARLALINSAHQ